MSMTTYRGSVTDSCVALAGTAGMYICQAVRDINRLWTLTDVPNS